MYSPIKGNTCTLKRDFWAFITKRLGYYHTLLPLGFWGLSPLLLFIQEQLYTNFLSRKEGTYIVYSFIVHYPLNPSSTRGNVRLMSVRSSNVHNHCPEIFSLDTSETRRHINLFPNDKQFEKGHDLS